MKMKTHFSLDAIQPEGNGKASSMLPSAAHILKKKKKKASSSAEREVWRQPSPEMMLHSIRHLVSLCLIDSPFPGQWFHHVAKWLSGFSHFIYMPARRKEKGRKNDIFTFFKDISSKYHISIERNLITW